MIATQQKPWEEILAFLKGLKNIFLIGCSQCATSCQTGGEPEIAAMKKKLENAGKIIVGSLIGHEDCHILDIKRELRQHKKKVEKTDAILVMACGAGAQSVMLNSPDRAVFTANNTMFLGNIRRTNQIFEEHCSLCGDCLLNLTAGHCPMTMCAKGLSYGPCGGPEDEKCEDGSGRECAWTAIFNRLKALGLLDNMGILATRQHKHLPHPRSLNIKEGR